MSKPNAPGKPALEHILQNSTGKTAEIRSITIYSGPPGIPNAKISVLIVCLLLKFHVEVLGSVIVAYVLDHTSQ